MPEAGKGEGVKLGDWPATTAIQAGTERRAEALVRDALAVRADQGRSRKNTALKQ